MPFPAFRRNENKRGDADFCVAPLVDCPERFTAPRVEGIESAGGKYFLGGKKGFFARRESRTMAEESGTQSDWGADTKKVQNSAANAPATKNKSRAKRRANGFRLAALVTIMLLCLMVYLPVRQQRLNTTLIDVLVQENDPSRVHALLESGADANARQIGFGGGSGASSLLDWLRILFRRRDYSRLDSSRTALMIAVSGRKNEITKDLLAHGANVNVRLKSGTTALLQACAQRQADIAKILLAHGADWRVCDHNGLTPLLVASDRGAPDTLSALLDKGANVHEPDRKGRAPLVIAVEARQTENVRRLLERGATLQDVAGAVPAPLAWAAKNGATELLALAWSAAPSLRPTDPQCGAALLEAIGSHTPDAVKFLLDKGVPVNPTGPQQGIPQTMMRQVILPGTNPNTVTMVTTMTVMANGAMVASSTPIPLPRGAPRAFRPIAPRSFVTPPLVAAAGAGEPAIVKMLLARGANANAADPQGVTPLMRVAQLIASSLYSQPNRAARPSPSAPVANNIAIAEMLQAHGAKINAADNIGNTPLAYACEVQNPEMLQWLIRQGAKVNVHFLNTQTPLIRAANLYDPKSIKILLDAGADPNVADANGMTPLMATHSPEVAALLLKRGANANARDKTGSTALIQGARSYNDAVVRLLIQQRVSLNLKDNQGHTALSEARARNLQPMVDMLTQAGAK